MKAKAKTLLIVMNFLAWGIFIGLMIKAGAIIISYLVSIGNADAAKNLYMGMDLYDYRKQSFVHYTFLVGYKVIFYIIEAFIAFLMTRLLSRLNISKPFNAEVVRVMQKITYSILFLWLIAMANNIHAAILEKNYGLPATYISGDSIFLAGIAYILAQMFKRGVLIQSENELTV